jgi:Asp-tRNA(Asn)/Glu-tRNA(Gln) amidotransferase C subunit|tara:strand:+ start:255 stop:509 length:255 start_codon:yes stop_codon:yes gene_type:complete
MDFLWHKVSDKEKEQIKKDAKAIMDSFSKKLARVDKKISEPVIERDEFERVENSSKGIDIDRKTMFENAPNKNDDFIIAEKGGW